MGAIGLGPNGRPWDCRACGYDSCRDFAEAAALVRRADALLVAGSSLVVNSGIRLLDQAAKRRIPIVIVNRGVTKGDPRASLKIWKWRSCTNIGRASSTAKDSTRSTKSP